MQENRSFDNYFGVLPYVHGTPYHKSGNSCSSTDHKCVDGLAALATAQTVASAVSGWRRRTSKRDLQF